MSPLQAIITLLEQKNALIYSSLMMSCKLLRNWNMLQLILSEATHAISEWVLSIVMGQSLDSRLTRAMARHFFGELSAQVYHFEKGSKLDFLIWAQKIWFGLGSSFLDSTHYYLGSYPFCNDSTVTPPLGLGWYLVIIQDLFGEDSTIRMRKYSLY